MSGRVLGLNLGDVQQCAGHDTIRVWIGNHEAPARQSCELRVIDPVLHCAPRPWSQSESTKFWIAQTVAA